MRWKNKKEWRQQQRSKMKIEWVANFFIPLLVAFSRVKSCQPLTPFPLSLPPPLTFLLCVGEEKISPAADVTYMIQRIFVPMQHFFFHSRSPTLVLLLHGFPPLEEAVISRRDLYFTLPLPHSHAIFFFIVKWKIYRFSPWKKEKKSEGNYGKKGFSPRDSLMMENLCLH